MDGNRKQGVSWQAVVRLASPPVLGGVLLTAIVLKRRRAHRRRKQQAGCSGNDTSNEVGKEVQAGDIDDPWPPPGKSSKSPKSSKEAAEMPEPLPTILLEETLPISPRELWRLVMGNPDFLKSVSKLKKNRDLKVGQWRLSKGDTAERRITYITPFKKQVIGPKEAKVTEVYESKGVPEQSFAVDVKVHTPEVPYGSSFHSHLQWDAVSVGENQTRLRVSCEVAFTKPCLVKGIVKKASLEGMKESYGMFRGLLLDHLKMHLGSLNSRGSGNGRRPAVHQLLLLLLLGAIFLSAIMAFKRHLAGELSWVNHRGDRAASLLADAAAALRRRAAPV